MKIFIILRICKCVEFLRVGVDFEEIGNGEKWRG